MNVHPVTSFLKTTFFPRWLVMLAACACLTRLPANDSIYPPEPAAAAVDNFDGRGFILNGERTFVASGDIHYPRVPQALWRDRLLRLKRAGLNCVQTYAFMNYHSPQEGVYDFSGEKDFNLYLQTIGSLGLYATVRPGLYICSEWENGGYPEWLLQKPGVSLRTNEARFLAASDAWYQHVLSIVATNQINRGGAVILVQLENEHPALWGTDTSITPVPYFQHLRTNALARGIEVPMFFSGLHHGSDPSTTGGTIPWDSVGRDSPWYTSEFWAVWSDQFGETLSQAQTLDRNTWKLLAYGANGYNYYMFHGGGNFDHWNNDETAASYDYAAAIGQAGDLRPFYYRAKRAALFARTFQNILENSTNASGSYAGAALNVSAITARGSSNGTILFLDNNSANTVTAVLTNGAQMKLEVGEIAAVIKNAPLTSWLKIQQLDAHVFGAQPQGNMTTLVLYGLPGETATGQFLVTNGLAISAGAGFTVSTNNAQLYKFAATVVDGAPTSYSLSAGTNTLRVLVASKTMVDRTWFVNSGSTNYVVCGPAYLGDFTNNNGQFAGTLEEPFGSPLPSNVLVYATALNPTALTITNQVDPRNLTAPLLTNWQMRTAAAQAATNFDDSTWFSASTPPLMGADGSSEPQAWYRAKTSVAADGSYTLNLAGIQDWGLLFVNGQQAAMQPGGSAFSVPVQLQAGTNTIAIFTAHYGRNKLYNVIGTSANTFTPKGLLGAVTLSPGGAIGPWKMQGGVGAYDGPGINWGPVAATGGAPTFYRAQFQYAPAAGTLPILRAGFSGLSHGFIWLNGHNLGRYPEKVPTKGIYLPECWLAPTNTLVIFDEASAAPDEVVLMVETNASRYILQAANPAATLPYPPALLTAAPADAQVTLNWSAVANATGYNLKRATVAGGPYTPLTTNWPALSWTDSGLTNGTKYYYVVSGTDGGHQTPDSLATSATPNPPPPTAPTGLTAQAIDQKVMLSWNASVGSAGYLVKRSSTSGGPYLVIGSTATSPAFTNIGLTVGKPYHFVVSATNAFGESSDSAEATAMVLPPGQLTGSILGTAGSWNNLGNTSAKAFDQDFSTYFDAPDASGDWVGVDLGATNTITAVAYCPRTSDGNPYPQRMIGGVFQGASDPAFSNPTTLFTITATPPQQAMTRQAITNATPFRYVRYMGPASSYCNVAELVFYGYSTPPTAPKLGWNLNGQQLQLTWPEDHTGWSLQVQTNIGSGCIRVSGSETGNQANVETGPAMRMFRLTYP